MPARLVEIASIQRQHKRSVTSDVLSSVEFSQDGMLLATAGRAKQVGAPHRLVVPHFASMHLVIAVCGRLGRLEYP